MSVPMDMSNSKLIRRSDMHVSWFWPMSAGMSATNCVPMKLRQIKDNKNQRNNYGNIRKVDGLTQTKELVTRDD